MVDQTVEPTEENVWLDSDREHDSIVLRDANGDTGGSPNMDVACDANGNSFPIDSRAIMR